MVLIAPSILSSDFTNMQREIADIERSGADWLHIDIMDGHFVPNITIGPDIVKQIRPLTGMPLDVHLMISDPDRYLDDFSEAGADIITVHAEATTHLHRSIQKIRSLGKKAGVSLNPATPLSELGYVLQDVDVALIMSVNPGFGGQSFIPQIMEKISTLKKIIRENDLTTAIEVDGGVKLENAKEIADAGADILVMGSGFFSHEDYTETVRRFKETVGS
ncbi:MAG TPA: ribulose-phosphate 3-epimerase [Nitrospirae bacterium]|nr:ribulose-phosphate 3-epimerase [Nitrospirota bacterium]HDO21531.1 ribulose-phosphate 3-epimerase [Nitrospirota bacterium]